MKNLFLKVLSTSLLYAATTFAQSATEIAKKVHDLPSGKTSSATISVTLIDKNGKTRNREIASYTMKDGSTDKTVLVFKTPRDVAGISYLTYDYPDKADGSTVDSDSWIYLPAMKKVRRVSGSSKDDDFQGTDFTYDDLGTRSLSKDNFALLGEEKVNGVDCWILEAKAKDAKAKVSREYLVRAGREIVDIQPKTGESAALHLPKSTSAVFTASGRKRAMSALPTRRWS